jgi:hypothetical protein
MKSPLSRKLMMLGSMAGLVLAGDQQFFGMDEITVLPGQADGLAAVAVDQVDDFLVHVAAQHHLYDVHGFVIGDAHALDEHAFLAQLVQHVIDLRAAAMHHHRVHADQLEQYHVLGEALLKVFICHGIAAVFDHDGFIEEALDVRQSFSQRLGFLGSGRIVQHH